MKFYSYDIQNKNMENEVSAQVQVEVRMKKSQHFYGNLLRQEFELEPLHDEQVIWPILTWNNTDLKNETKDLPKWTNGTNGDVVQNLKDLKRNSKYTFFIRMITQFEKGSSLSHQCEYNETLSTDFWPCGNGNEIIPSNKVINE